MKRRNIGKYMQRLIIKYRQIQYPFKVVFSKNSVLDLKLKIKNVLKFKVNRQELYWNYQILENEDLFANLDINDGARIILTKKKLDGHSQKSLRTPASSVYKESKKDVKEEIQHSLEIIDTLFKSSYSLKFQTNSIPIRDEKITKEDLVYQNDIFDHLVCSLCSDLVNQAVTCKKCDKNFCTQCIINEHQDKQFNKKCPSCKSKWEDRKLDKALQKMLESINVICKFEECSEIVKWNALSEHMQDCKFRKLMCIYCNHLCSQNQMINHLKICKFVVKNCPYESNGCKFTGSKIDLFSHVMNKCDHMSLQCLGCQSPIEYKNYYDHINTCALVNIKCSTCGFSALRETFDPHECANVIFKALKMNKATFWEEIDNATCGKY